MESIPFLKEIAKLLLQPGEFDLPHTSIVFPNKRARLYLSKYIGELTDRPVWAPQYFTISDMMEEISGSVCADRLTLLFELFESYRNVTGSVESFDTFYPYSETLLADFDEIDKYMVNADDLFSNLSGLKSMDGRFSYLSDEQVALIRRFWSTFNPDKVSEGQAVFISLWDALPEVYHAFRNSLNIRQMAYEGMAYRKAIENLNMDAGSNLVANQKYLFVGFNALNTCEEMLFSHLKTRNQAAFFWDYDSWYTGNEDHEAGYFIRRNMKSFPQARPLNHENLLQNKRNVLFVPVSSNSGQATLLPQIFDKLHLHETKDIERTALVLADESLLIPALYAIPEYVADVNVTMGYPIAGSAVCNLIDSLFELSRNSRKKADGSPEWYFSDVLAIMSNPLLSALYKDNIACVRELAQVHHLVYLHKSDILKDQSDDMIFNDHFHQDACKFVLGVITGIIRKLPGEHQESATLNSVQGELLFQVYTFLTRLQDILSTHQFVPGPDVILRLIRKMIRTMHIPFSGEPLSGLQVLGVLETRTLDFDNVILLSANEGVFPKSSDKPSFIPRNLRAGFNMPTPEHYDAIYAYYFYRLLQRAQHVALVYNGSSGGLRTGERSRFLHQLYYEMNLPVTEVVIESPISQLPVKSIVIEKTEKDLMPYFGETGHMLSPSAINEFLNCSLQFYFHRVAGIPQKEEVAEEIDARLFGNILHHALRLIYEDFGKTLITKEKLEAVLRDEKIIHHALDASFNRELFNDLPDRGTRKPAGFNLIVRQVIFTYIKQFIKAEQESCPFTIVGLEEKVATTIPIIIHGTRFEVKVGGVIDRIDRNKDKIRILDYKTGAVKDVFTTVESLFDSSTKRRNDAAFQVLLYAFVYERLHRGESIVPGLFFIRESHSEGFSGSLRVGPKKDILSDFGTIRQEFGMYLEAGLKRLLDTAEPYSQAVNLHVCRYCPYAMICRREGEIPCA